MPSAWVEDMAALPLEHPGPESCDSAAGVLAALESTHSVLADAEIGQFRLAVEWAIAHSIESVADIATVEGSEGELAIAGPGAPLVAEFCVADFALAIGVTTDAGRCYLGDAVEVRYRLPLLWEQVMAGRVPVWKARRITDHTHSLPADAAAHVDRQLAPIARRVSYAQIERTVEAARATYDPVEAEQRRHKAADGRFCDVDTTQVGLNGTMTLRGELDLADALDFNDALTTGAQQLADLGCTETLDVPARSPSGPSWTWPSTSKSPATHPPRASGNKSCSPTPPACSQAVAGPRGAATSTMSPPGPKAVRPARATWYPPPAGTTTGSRRTAAGGCTASVSDCSYGPAPTAGSTPDICDHPTPPATADGAISMPGAGPTGPGPRTVRVRSEPTVPAPRHTDVRTSLTAAILAATAAATTSCGTLGSASTAEDPVVHADEAASHAGEVCPPRLPIGEDPGGHGFGTESAAQELPSLLAPETAWVCRYDTMTAGRAPGGGARYSWDRTEPARLLDAATTEELADALDDLTLLEGEQACTADLGPRWMVVYDHGGDLTGVVVDDYGCRDVRLTDEPFATPPGAPGQEGMVEGILGGGADLLEGLGLGG